MRVVIKKADQADGHNIPIASRYSFQISASLPQKKPRGGILRRRKPTNILATDRYGGFGARPVPVSVPLTSTLAWPGEAYQKMLEPTEFVDAEQWIEAVDSKGTSYYRQDEKNFLSETTVEEMPQQESADGTTTYMCSTCNFGSTDFNDFSAHICSVDDSLVPQEIQKSGVKERGEEKRVRKVEPIERAIAEILMNIESYDNAGQQGGDAAVQGDDDGSQGEEEVVMEYVETSQQGEESQQGYELGNYIQEETGESAPLQMFVTDVPEVSENTTVVASSPQKVEKRKSVFPAFSNETHNCVITLHPQTYGDVKHEFTCDPCQSQYSNMNGYALHMFKVHHVKVSYDFMCENCQMMFSGFRFLIEHVTEGVCISAKPVPQYQPCDRCPMKFRTVDILRSHMVSVHSVDCLWHCDECALEFSSQLNFESHDCASALQRRRRHDYRCKVCLRCFPSRHILSQHYKMAHYDSYSRRRNMTMRLLRRGFGKENFNRSGIGYYILPEPLPGPTDESRSGKSKVHDEIADKQCAKCDLQFDSSTDLDRHLENDHDESGEFECAFCGEEFTTRAEMRMHIDFEHGFKSYSPIEPKESEGAAKKMPGAAAQLSPDLMSDVRSLVFKNPKKRTCDICAVNVRTNVDLLDHVLLHSVEDIKEIIASRNRSRLATCKFCNKVFPEKVIPHACRKVKCPYCRGWFAGQQYLTKHIKTLHAAGTGETEKNSDARYKSKYGTHSKQNRASRPSRASETVPLRSEEEDTVEEPTEAPHSEALDTGSKGEVVSGDVEFKMAELFSEETEETTEPGEAPEGGETENVPEKTAFELKDVMQTCGIGEDVVNTHLDETENVATEEESPKIVYVNEAGEIIPESEIHFVDENKVAYVYDPQQDYDENAASQVDEASSSQVYIVPDDHTEFEQTREYSQENLAYLDSVQQGDVVYLVNEQNEILNFQCQFCGVGFELQEAWAKHEEMHQLMETPLVMQDSEENSLV